MTYPNITEPLPKRTKNQFSILTGAVLLTFGWAAWGLYIHRHLRLSAFTLADLVSFSFEPYRIGIAVSSFFAPLFLLYLLSQTQLFQKILIGERLSRPSLKLFAVLGALQVVLLPIEYQVFRHDPDMYMLGMLVVISAGLLGGWRVGLGVALLSSLVIIGSNIFGDSTFFRTLPLAPEGQAGLRSWLEFVWLARIIPFYLHNQRAVLPLWVGLWAAVYAVFLNNRRYEPLFTWLLGVLLAVGAGYLLALSSDEPSFVVSLILPAAMACGLASLSVGLLIRNLQAGLIRRKADRAELAMAQAELRALRAQINPHFLFNALNTIRYCVRTDPQAARQLLLDLSELFQHILRAGDFVPLEDEIEHVKAYLSLEKARLGDRLAVEWRLPEERLTWLDQPVPTLILQPIVENAIVHGLAPKSAGGRLIISTLVTEAYLLLVVQDDGAGFAPERLEQVLGSDQEPVKSIGIRNVDGRLRALYGDECRLRVESLPGEGARVEMRIPLVSDRGRRVS